MKDDATSYPTQFAFNASDHDTYGEFQKDGVVATDKIYIEGGSGIKPVVKAREIKRILNEQIAQAGIKDPSEVVINKATIILPYEVEGGYEALDAYPMVLSPTVRLRSSEGGYVSYAGLTDSSIETENQGDINRSLSMYAPDISHHVQEILKQKPEEGESVIPTGIKKPTGVHTNAPVSTDAGCVTRLAPTSRLHGWGWVYGTPGHSWGIVASSGHELGLKAAVHAGMAQAQCGYDIAKDPSVIKEWRADLDRQLAKEGNIKPILPERRA